MTDTTLTPKQLDLMLAIKCEQVTWHNRNSRGITYRLWESESIYKVVTRLMKGIPDHLFERQMVHGYTFIQRGYCELTPEGHRTLRGGQPMTEKGSNDG